MDRPAYLSIFRYVDPVKFLNDAYSFQSAENPDFTLNTWARSIGLKTSQALTQYLDGNRSIPLRIVPKLAKSLGLTGTERRYLEALLGIYRAKTASDQEIWMTRAQEIYESIAVELEAVEDLRLLDNPVLSALLALVERPDFRLELNWVQRRLNFPIDPKTLQESFDYLLARGFIVHDSAGRMCRVRQSLGARQERFNRIYTESLARHIESKVNAPASA